MNVVTRGIKNAIRSPLRSGAIVLMLAISIGLILCMLVARGSVNAKIDEVKSSSGNNITINPAGVRGFAGGGNYLTSDILTKVKETSHVSSVASTLSDQMSTDDTNLTSSLELGDFGQRMQRSDSSSDSNSSDTSDESGMDGFATNMPAPTPRITVTGTTDPDSVSSDGSELNIISGKTFDASSDDLAALIGTDLAEKNSLSVGDNFTAYEKTITVVGIYETGNTFEDSNIIMPIATVQSLIGEEGSVSSITAVVDSSENIKSTVSSLESALGDDVDITSEVERAETMVSSLKGIASLALAGVIGAAVAGAVIILLAMVMIVRERRREIGVIKAIGGTNTKVIGQFVTEALTLTIIGAIIGLSLGVLVSGPMTTSLVSSSSNSTSTSQGRPQGGPGGMMRTGMQQISKNLTQVTASLTPQIFASAVGITLLIAIAGSAVPAWFIARVRPAEVLRTE